MRERGQFFEKPLNYLTYANAQIGIEGALRFTQRYQLDDVYRFALRPTEKEFFAVSLAYFQVEYELQQLRGNLRRGRVSSVARRLLGRMIGASKNSIHVLLQQTMDDMEQTMIMEGHGYTSAIRNAARKVCEITADFPDKNRPSLQTKDMILAKIKQYLPSYEQDVSCLLEKTDTVREKHCRQQMNRLILSRVIPA